VPLRPGLQQATNGRDSLLYSLLATTLSVSPQLTVTLTHGVDPNDSVVRASLVSFAIVSHSDPQLGDLVNDSKRASTVDTTNSSGVAGRAIRLHPLFLTSPVDSIIVNATAKYRGAQVSGSPVRLVLLLKPRS